MKRAVVVGRQIYLRPLEYEDIEGGYHDWINDYEVFRGLLSPLPQTRESLANYVDRSRQPDCVIFAVCDKESDRFIGTTRLSSIDWIHRNGVYGGMIGPAAFRGKGYGSDMLIQIIRYGFHFLGLNRIWSAAWIEHEVTLKANLEKVGMKNEGTMRNHVYKDGEFHDCVVLGILRSDFDEKHGGPESWSEIQRPQA